MSCRLSQMINDFADIKILEKTLNKMGYSMTVSKSQLKGYYTEKVDYVINGTQERCGIRVNEDNTLTLIGDGDFMRNANLLKQAYAQEALTEIMETNGFQIESCDQQANGDILLVAVG